MTHADEVIRMVADREGETEGFVRRMFGQGYTYTLDLDPEGCGWFDGWGLKRQP